jgi:hypothetical protein
LPNVDRKNVEEFFGNSVTALDVQIVAALLLSLLTTSALLQGSCHGCGGEGQGDEDVLNKHFGCVEALRMYRI